MVFLSPACPPPSGGGHIFFEIYFSIIKGGLFLCKHSFLRFLSRFGVCSVGGLLVLSLVVSLPLSASADTIQINPTYAAKENNALVTFVNTDDMIGDSSDNQYTYGGVYNPLILSRTDSSKWLEALVAVRWDFGKEYPAGTVLDISAGGWYSKNYTLSSANMYASLTCPRDYSSWLEFLGSSVELPALSSSSDGAVQTSNGNYKARLFNGKYTLPTRSSYVYIVFDFVLSAARTSGAYLGVSCSSITYQGTPKSPAESEFSNDGDDVSGALDDLDNAESGLKDATSGDLEFGKNLQLQVKNDIVTYTAAFQVISKVFAKMLNIVPGFSLLVSMSASLGLFMFLLGMVGEVYRGINVRDADRADENRRFWAEYKREYDASRPVATITKSKVVSEDGIRLTITQKRRL